LVGQAVKQITAGGQENNAALFALGENWGAGIMGLIAEKSKTFITSRRSL